ncbi:MAG: AAA family ATPase [Micavibrio sp.]
MSVNSLSVSGYRGFATKQKVTFAKPDGKNEGSGLTFLLGANNSGKSTFLESLKFFGLYSGPELNESQRNEKTSRKVEIELNYLDNLTATIKTVSQGGSSTEMSWPDDSSRPKIYCLPSRRFFNHEFDSGRISREEMMHSLAKKSRNIEALTYFPISLFNITNNPEELNKYNEFLNSILGYELKWHFNKENRNFIQYEIDTVSHRSEGVGDGIINLMIIAKAICDASPTDTIIIDEPEVSLHPSAQKRLFAALKKLSKTTQIVLATHSPYFIDFEAIEHGAQIARFYKEGDEIRIAEISPESHKIIKSFLNNASNPHVLGTNAKEILFVEDCVLLVEGQDDVICFEKASKELGIPINGYTFGWGVGGETNMRYFVELLKALGYKKVCGILDKNAKDFNYLKSEYPEYAFLQISTNDIRDKEARKEKNEITGLFTKGYELKPESKQEIQNTIYEINKRFLT